MKRFTDTNKWQDKWFRRLSTAHKLAWLYMCDQCDAAGVIELDDQLANFQIGEDVDWDEFVEGSEGRIERLECGRLWIVRFVQFQYPRGVSTSKQHAPSRESVRKYSLPTECPSNGHSLPIECPSNDSQETETDKKQKQKQKQTRGEVAQVIECYQQHHPKAKPGIGQGWNVDYTKEIDGPIEHGFDYFWGCGASLDMPPYLYLENNKILSIPTVVNAFNRRPGPAARARCRGGCACTPGGAHGGPCR